MINPYTEQRMITFADTSLSAALRRDAVIILPSNEYCGLQRLDPTVVHEVAYLLNGPTRWEPGQGFCSLEEDEDWSHSF